MVPLVAIVGRENVGKSTLFNRLVAQRDAIVDKTPGVTRDRNIKEVELFGKSFLLVDTGGYLPCAKGLKSKVVEQVEVALKSARLILFVVDGKDGLMPLDLEFATRLRPLNKKVLVVVNKIDTYEKSYVVSEFDKLGFGDRVGISAIHGMGINELIDKILENIPQPEESAEKKQITKFAIIGRPNVGKSTYINALLREPRVIVDEQPGTTIDSIDVTLNYEGQPITLIDTPGLRRRTKIASDIEYYSAIRTQLTISRCDVAILLVDATLPLTRQDKHIISKLINNHKGIVVAVNKIDLGVAFRESAMRFAEFVPITYMSALNNDRIYEPMKLAIRVFEARKKHIPKSKLRELIELREKLGIRSIVQVRVEPPTFRVTTNRELRTQERRFIERTIRERFGFIGTPIKIIVP